VSKSLVRTFERSLADLEQVRELLPGNVDLASVGHPGQLTDEDRASTVGGRIRVPRVRCGENLTSDRVNSLKQLSLALEISGVCLGWVFGHGDSMAENPYIGTIERQSPVART
jgi:hypothetical protein